MTKKSKLLISLTGMLLVMAGIGYFVIVREEGKPDHPSGSNATSQSPAPAASPTASAYTTPTASPGTAGPEPPPTSSNVGPKAAVTGLVDARFNNDESKARQFGSDIAVRQIYSFPRFNAREASISCSEQGDKATCSVSSPAAGGSMIVSLLKTTSGWRVEQIEPVID